MPFIFWNIDYDPKLDFQQYTHVYYNCSMFDIKLYNTVGDYNLPIIYIGDMQILFVHTIVFLFLLLILYLRRIHSENWRMRKNVFAAPVDSL